ncbi:TfoX/Sxy family protein [Candidatus Fermentibacterales bacterium]|nr:TfoX/Sxy family protein [Candidatus Fermentibacterales bacterium]
MPVSRDFLEFCLDQLRELPGISAKRMFGGAGLFHEGRMFGLIAGDVLYLKADDSGRRLYEEKGTGPFRPYRNRDSTMPYYEVPAEILDDPDELGEWARASMRVASKSGTRTAPGRRRG